MGLTLFSLSTQCGFISITGQSLFQPIRAGRPLPGATWPDGCNFRRAASDSVEPTAEQDYSTEATLSSLSMLCGRPRTSMRMRCHSRSSVSWICGPCCSISPGCVWSSRGWIYNSLLARFAPRCPLATKSAALQARWIRHRGTKASRLSMDRLS